MSVAGAAGDAFRTIRGRARCDRLTKRLAERLRPGDIAVIAHEDLDELAGESLARKKPAAVLNALDSATGRCLNGGPKALLRAGIPLLDRLGGELVERVAEGNEVLVEADTAWVNGAEFRGRLFTSDDFERAETQAKLVLRERLEDFVTNTLSYIRKEGHLLVGQPTLPPLTTEIAGRHCVVVCRSGEYEQDLRTIQPYIRERRPVLIAVDGATDGILSQRLHPGIIFGDMDSVSDEGLRCGAEIVVHAYPNGEAPGLGRVEKLGLEAKVFPCPGTSEDAALLLAYHGGADLLVSVGTRWSLEEFVGRGRKGMASTYLTRLRIASRLVDARGVSRLYRRPVGLWHLLGLALSGLLVVGVLMAFSPFLRGFLELLGAQVRMFWRAVGGLFSL